MSDFLALPAADYARAAFALYVAARYALDVRELRLLFDAWQRRNCWGRVFCALYDYDRLRAGEGGAVKATMKKAWVRPHGCQCDETTPAKWRCTAQWMRCQARIDYEARVNGEPIVKVPSTLRRSTP